MCSYLPPHYSENFRENKYFRETCRENQIFARKKTLPTILFSNLPKSHSIKIFLFTKWSIVFICCFQVLPLSMKLKENTFLIFAYFLKAKITLATIFLKMRKRKFSFQRLIPCLHKFLSANFYISSCTNTMQWVPGTTVLTLGCAFNPNRLMSNSTWIVPKVWPVCTYIPWGRGQRMLMLKKDQECKIVLTVSVKQEIPKR